MPLAPASRTTVPFVRRGSLSILSSSILPAGHASVSDGHLREFHGCPGTLDDDNAAVGHEVTLAVLLEIVADHSVRRNFHIFLQNATAQLRPTTNVAVIEDDGIGDLRAGMHEDMPADHRILHRPA